MKANLIILTIFFCSLAKGQEIDSAWIIKAYFPALSIDTGVLLPEPNLIDKEGKKRSLSEFRGKLLYIDVWTTWCGNCIVNFPRAKKLYERLQYLHLDSAIQFINICTEDSKADWEEMLIRHSPTGVNFYATDTILYQTWKIDAFPRYLIVDRQGKIMSLDGVHLDDGLIDYVLYAATKGIKPAEAVWIDYRQNKHFRIHRKYTDDAEGIDYSNWFRSISPLKAKDALEERNRRLQKGNR